MGVFVRRTTVGAVAAVVMALAGAGVAQAAWSGVGSLASGRYNHTATTLQDGRVLVTGGNNGDRLAGAQLYDPATNGWSNAAPMNFARHGHAAALLPSDKVLVAGGFAPTADPVSLRSGYTRTAEIYDPTADTWTKTGSMSTGRFQPTMTVLPGGRVLVAGGSGDIDTGHGINEAVPLSSAEIYNPSTGTWSDAASMSVPRAMHTATLLEETGEVLVAGGLGGATGELSSAELYDPKTDTWATTGSLAEARDSATATALPNGDVLVAGGDGGGSALASAELYRPAAGTWRAARSMAGARQMAAAALLKDGTVLVAGGKSARSGSLLDTTERYDPAADTWTDAGTMAVARIQHSLTALDDGRALVVGGNAGGFNFGLAGVERFSTVTTTLTPASFESAPIGTPSAVVTSVLTNTGSTPLVVTGVSVAGAHAGDFAIESESCLASAVAPGETCQIALRFTPTAAGARSATLTVADNNTAAGTTTAPVTGTGEQPAPAAGETSPGGAAPTGASAAISGTAGAGQTRRTPAAATAGARSESQSARGPAARTTCTVKTTRRNGRRRTTVSCRMTWPTRAAVTLRARLMRGRTVLASTRTTARAGRAALSLRPARKLRPGRYTVTIARRDGTMVVRQKIRVS